MNKITERTRKQLNTDRRRFLENIGRWGVSSSLLRLSPLAGAFMGARMAQAQAGQKKLVFIYHPNGSPDGRYVSQGWNGAGLEGPGIKSRAAFSLPEIDAFVANAALFPLGCDFYFTCADQLAGLPRTTKVEGQPCT